MADYDTMFGLMNPTGTDPLAFGQALIQNPESLAPIFAQMGPPPTPQPPMQSGAGFLPGPQPGQTPLPTARPTGGGPGAPLDLAAVGGLPTGPTGAQPAARAGAQNPLAGVKTPTAPAPQRISSPNAPRPQQIDQRSQILQLIQQILGERGQRGQVPNLGALLGGIR